MDVKELRERLQKIGVDISERTIRRWGEKGLIEDHRRNLFKRGRGHAADWPEVALQETCAVWAVRHSYSYEPRVLTNKILTNEKIREIKKEAKRVYEYPFAYYDLAYDVKLTGPNPSTIYSHDALTLKVVDDNELDALVKIWIAALEKAKRGKVICKPKKVVFHWRSIIKPSDTIETSGKWTFTLHDVVLEEADRDELVFLLDGMDSRKKAMYAPFNEYDPLVKYDPFESYGEMKQRVMDALDEDSLDKIFGGSTITLAGSDLEAAKRQTVTIPLLTYWKLAWCRDFLEGIVYLKQNVPYETVLYWLKQIDLGELNWEVPILLRRVSKKLK